MDAPPRVSTAGSFFTMAFLAAILLVPTAITMVTIDASASGIAATARATANMKASMKSAFLIMLSANIPTDMNVIPIPSFLLKSSSLS